eukprot:CAMPEP_0117522316 /NCGR_PEP_ID=MMETSP0784-20121206/34145_1 /TAXON_ID=39447 /ORGANISM="" /LENGTH=523 /DNA_ID=CAMNT_0005318385 /DNA_START=292 /DNA_END=1859 /DNA_ORIENTATION=-
MEQAAVDSACCGDGDVRDHEPDRLASDSGRVDAAPAGPMCDDVTGTTDQMPDTSMPAGLGGATDAARDIHAGGDSGPNHPSGGATDTAPDSHVGDGSGPTELRARVDGARQSCDICGKRGFRAATALLNHLRNQHRGEPNLVERLAALMPPGEARCARVLGGSLRVAWEDEWLAIVVKPQGIRSKGTRGSLERADWLIGQLRPSVASDAFRAPRPTHRLDAGTGGLLVFAKTLSAAQGMQALFEERRVKKRYRALVHGRLDVGTEGVCEEPVDGKPARTRYRVALPPADLPDGCVSTVDLWPCTGRRHQLRKHLASIGHPIVGDKRYGGWQLGEDAHGVGHDNGEDSGDSDGGGGDGDSQLHRSFCLWALGIHFPHPARWGGRDGARNADGDKDGDGDSDANRGFNAEPALDAAGELSQESDLDVRVLSEDWEDLLLNFNDGAPKKKRKAKPSNIVKKAAPGKNGLQLGDLLIAIEGVTVGNDVAQALQDAKPPHAKPARLSFRRSAARVRAEIEEPAVFREV